jgi:hypothetical protein
MIPESSSLFPKNVSASSMNKVGGSAMLNSTAAVRLLLLTELYDNLDITSSRVDLPDAGTGDWMTAKGRTRQSSASQVIATHRVAISSAEAGA